MTAGLPAPTAARAADRQLLRFAARAMGSPLRLAIVVPGRQPWEVVDVAGAWAAVRDEFEASEEAMSRFRDASEITLLNRRAGSDEPTAVSRRLSRALQACDRAQRLTGGRFDPRVLADLERLGDHGARIGQEGPVEADRSSPGGRIVERDAGGQVRLPAPVDLGGIGKGLALRWAATTLRRRGFEAFLVEAGGDLVASGAPPEGGPWRIGIEDPAGEAEPLAAIASRDEAVATSSVRRRHWSAGDRTVHHLVDPRTGEPGGAGLLAVTVAGLDPAWSEVWSKTLFLEGQAGIAGLARRRGLAAWWVADDGSLEMTAAGRLRTIWTADEGRGPDQRGRRRSAGDRVADFPVAVPMGD
ncbi:MAG: FAD:protein FMN transferase [Candidatus Limnocylindrales bacterium]|nr:FAD:protein FMN transferase [Candidatus Limnocylindrales bacterium]